MFTANENSVDISVPITKVNREKRTVSGFATLDNVDVAKDIVTAEASQKAFQRWRGNIREMHGKDAVGKAVDFSAKKYYDAESDMWYNGVYVTAYISKGAPNTWEKVLDGTLTGFSIGGKTLSSKPVFDKNVGSAVNVITDYELLELSLVDNPCNQLANIFTIEKVAGGEDVVKGELTDLDTENIFFCADDSTAVTSKGESQSCSICEKPMENIGWVETDEAGREAAIRKAVQSKVGTTEDDSPSDENTEGGANMAKEDEKNDDVVEEVSEVQVDSAAGDEEPVTVDQETPAPVNDEVAKNVEVAEVSEAPEADLTKAIDDVRAEVESRLEAFEKTVGEAVASVPTALEGMVAEFTKQLGSVVELVNSVKEEVSALKTGHEEVAKSVDAVAKDTALKKSADVNVQAESKTDNIWNGSFLGFSSLKD